MRSIGFSVADRAAYPTRVSAPTPEDARWSLRKHLLAADLLVVEVKDARGAYFTGVMPLRMSVPIISIYVEIGPVSATRERQAIATGWLYIAYEPGKEDEVIDKLRARKATLAKLLRPL